MMDIQKIIDAMSKSMAAERSNYHVTLGEMIDALRASHPSKQVVCSDDTTQAPGNAGSYRGYYEDLAFSPVSAPVTVRQFLSECESALGSIFDGYKGGEFTMHHRTPLWVSEYGNNSGRAVVSTVDEPDAFVLVIKGVD
jgi:hypothetical protein